MKFQVCCNNCKRAVNVKNMYLNPIGQMEMNLSCGCKLYLEINRIKQLNED
jgi:hypothetical protein